MKYLLNTALAFTLLCEVGHATLLTNGGFEADGRISFWVTDGIEDSSSITGWTLATKPGYDTVYFTNNTTPEPTVGDGDFLMDFGGFGSTSGVATLWQDFATTSGETYNVSYVFSRYGSNDPSSTSFGATVSLIDIGTSTTIKSEYSGDAPPTPAGAFGMTPVGFSFVATGALTRIFIEDSSTIQTGNHLSIDNVQVNLGAVPEPSAALLGALGSLALLRRRRH